MSGSSDIVSYREHSNSVFAERKPDSLVTFYQTLFNYRHTKHGRNQLRKRKRGLIQHAQQLSIMLAALSPEEASNASLCQEAYDVAPILDWVLREESDPDGKRVLEELVENSIKAAPSTPLKAHLLLEKMRILRSDNALTNKQQENLLYEASDLFLYNKQLVDGFWYRLQAMLTRAGVWRL